MMRWLSKIRHVVWPDPEDVVDPSSAVIEMREDVRRLLDISEETRVAASRTADDLRYLIEQHDRDRQERERRDV